MNLDSLREVFLVQPDPDDWRRFKASIEVGPDPASCWTWKRCLSHEGYGRIRLAAGKYIAAHRAMATWCYGHIPRDLVTDHFVCNNRACVAPTHLLVCTQRENVLRRGSQSLTATRARQTHCHRGHALTPDNLCGWGLLRGERHCKLCETIRKQVARERDKRNREAIGF